MTAAAPRRHRRPVRLGLCPIGKFVFSHEDALRQKAILEAKLRSLSVSFVGIDNVLPDGLVRDQQHVDAVVRHFQRERIEALFIPHCNFGTEGAAGMIAKACGVPTLLWGPRDEAPRPDGTRLRDTLCGTLATSKVLHTLRVPFSYIVNSTVDDDCFTQGLDRFLRAARVARTMRTMRVGMIGQRIDFFWSTIVSEADLLQRFGVQVLPIEMPLFLQSLHTRRSHASTRYQQELASLSAWMDLSVYQDRDVLQLNLALRDEMLELAQRHDLDGFCLQTFNSIPQTQGLFLTLGVSLLNDLGIPVGPEGDLHGAVTSILLESASASTEPSFLPDITIRHPSNDNAVLLWHFEAPLSLRAPGSKVGHDLPWILKGMPPGTVQFKLKDGPVTLARFDGDSGGYRLGFGQGRMVDGPWTKDYFGWMEVDHWPTWEEQLVRGPYIHHCSCVFDHCADVLAEAARFVPGLAAERFGRPSY